MLHDGDMFAAAVAAAVLSIDRFDCVLVDADAEGKHLWLSLRLDDGGDADDDADLSWQLARQWTPVCCIAVGYYLGCSQWDCSSAD